MKVALSAVLLCVLLSACASAPRVHTDFDTSVDFARYRSYSWGLQPDTAIPPLMKQRMIAGIDQRLQAKGYTRLEEGGDLIVAAGVTTAEKTTIDTMYTDTGLGGWGWRGSMGMGMSSTQVRTYQVGTLIVDLFDAQTHRAIWRGTASGTVSSTPENNATAIETGLDEMFADYPPGSNAPR